jgi:hypothetical protein
LGFREEDDDGVESEGSEEVESDGHGDTIGDEV